MAAQSHLPRFLLTRPAAQGARFAADLRAAFPGARVTHSPLMAPEFRVPDLPGAGFSALVLTSETAVQGFRRLSAEMRAALPRLAWCVGDRTAGAARAAGLVARSAQGDADALVALMRGERPQGRLLYLHGADLRGDVAERLNSAGIETFSALIYDQKPQPLTPAARRLLAGRAPVIVPLFSPRTAALLAAQARPGPDRARLWVAALSPAVAQAAADLGAERLVIADRPDAPALIAAVAALIAAGPDA